MPLVNGRISAKKIIIFFSINIPHIYTFAFG